MRLNKPIHIDFDTFIWLEHNRAVFTAEDRLRAELHRMLARVA